MSACRNCGDALSSEEADYQDGLCTTCWNAEPDDLNAVDDLAADDLDIGDLDRDDINALEMDEDGEWIA
jgi:hypothetical protein